MKCLFYFSLSLFIWQTTEAAAEFDSHLHKDISSGRPSVVVFSEMDELLTNNGL